MAMAERKRYVVVSVATVRHTAVVYADDADSARRQADSHLRTMTTMAPHSGAAYNGNIWQMESRCGQIESCAKEATDGR